MFEKLRTIFSIPELRKKILLTVLLLGIYRFGVSIPLPIINQEALASADADSGSGFGRMIEYAAVFSAANLRQITIFGLGIMPYISASIIFQLLASVWKPLEDLQKEGEAGRKKINEYTRYATVVLCLVQSWFYVRWYLMSGGQRDNLVLSAFLNEAGVLSFYWQVIAVMTMTCGTIFLMWLGEQIDEYGIGNGISLLIMASILAQMPAAALRLSKNASFALGAEGINIEKMILLAALFVAVVFGIVFITLGQRRITTQSAKHVRGRRVMGGTRQYLPLRINQSGVMPIIFAGSLLIFPGMIFGGLSHLWSGFAVLRETFNNHAGLIYNLMYVALIYFFCYFWTAISFNPKEMADNLKNHGTFIPGYRPGKRTADYLEKVMLRITYVGAGFLALVAILPTIVTSSLNIDWQIASFYGGTSLLIAVSVVFDLVQKIDSHLVMRKYPGLLED